MLAIEYTRNTAMKGIQRDNSKLSAVVISTLEIIGLSRRSVYQVAKRKVRDRLIIPKSFINKYTSCILKRKMAQK